MSHLLERPIEDVLDVNAGDAQPHARSLILVEYRHRGASTAFVATLMVLIASLAITSHHRLTPPKVTRIEPPPAPTVAHVAPAADRPAAEPSGVPSARAPSPAPTAEPSPPMLAGDADRVAEPSRIEGPAAPDHPETPEQVLVVAATTTAPSAAPPPPPQPSAEEVEREILREAEQRKADLEDMERLKPAVRELREYERPQRAHEERVSFRKELRAILQQGGLDAGSRIAELCDQYGTELTAEQLWRLDRYSRRNSRQASPHEEVELLRALDVPEPAILAHLVHYWKLLLGNARNGFRDDDEARVTAARHLLKMPLPSQSAGRNRIGRP